MITLCILLYVLGALAIYALARELRDDNKTKLELTILTAIWPLAVAYGVASWVYRLLKEQ